MRDPRSAIFENRNRYNYWVRTPNSCATAQ